MRAIDTNILVRLATRDNGSQVDVAEAYVAADAWISTVTLAKTIWVLASTYRRVPSELAEFIEFLIGHRLLVLQDPGLAADALALFKSHPRLGFSDCLVLEAARRAGHLPLGTFDRNLGRVHGAQRI